MDAEPAGTAKLSYRLYAYALTLSRAQDHESARRVFEILLARFPNFCKAWVSYAQMEKRLSRSSTAAGPSKCREILQRGLRLNPSSACLAQAWGLMELQRGNMWAAVRLLERCASLDSTCTPVLKWKLVQAARQAVFGRSAQQSRARQAEISVLEQSFMES